MPKVVPQHFDSAIEHAQFGHVVAGHQIDLFRRHAKARESQIHHAYLGVGLHGGVQRLGVGDFDLDVIAPRRGHGEREIARRHQRNVGRAAEPYRRAVDRLALLYDGDVIEIGERPVEDTLALTGALVAAAHAVQDQDYAAAVALGAGAEAVAAGFGMAGLEAVGGAVEH